jgi:hypothetical protein
MKDRYKGLTSEHFDELLTDVVLADVSVSNLLDIPGVYEIVSEFFNNDVLAAWEVEQEGLTTI